MPLAERMEFRDLRVSATGKELKKEEQKEFEQVLLWLREAENASSETLYRKEAAEDYRFYAGDQDTAEVKAVLKEQNRPNSVFNEVKPKIDLLIGLGAQVRYDGQVVPVGQEDEPLAELMQGTLTHFRKKTKLGRKELDCFEHSVKSGRSLLYFTINSEEPFKPKIIPKRIPGSNFALDPKGLEYDLSDSRYIHIWSWVSEDELKAIDSDIVPGRLSSGIMSGDEVPNFYDELTDMYRINTTWYKKYELKYWFMNPFTGQYEGVDKNTYRNFIKMAMAGIENPQTGEVMKIDGPIPYVQAWGAEYKYMTYSGDYLIAGGKSPFNKKVGFPAVLYGAYKDDDNNRWFSAATMMKDPQRSVNTMRRQLVHLLQTLPKGILIHEIGAILDVEKYEQNSANPNFHLEVGKGQIDKLKFEKQPSISPIYQVLDEIMRKSMKDASGVQDELMGVYTASREPGVTLKAKQESGLAVLFIVFNNYRESRLEGNRKFMYLIQQYVQAPEIIRIQGDKGNQLMYINSQINPQSQGFNDITAGEYDLEMEETVETSTFRNAIADMLTEYSHNNPGVIPPDIIMDYLNIPFTVKQRIKEYWQAQQEEAQKQYEDERNLRILELEAKTGVEREKIKQAVSNKKEASNG